MTVLLGGAAASSGCAGPTTPLGAIWSLHPGDSSRVQWEEVPAPKAAAPSGPSRGIASIFSFGTDRKPQIHFDPPRQVLHGPRTVRVIVDDPRGIHDGYELQIRYRGHDVTRSFLLQAQITRLDHGERLMIEVPSIRFSPRTDHPIEVGYRNLESGAQVVSRYYGPVCRAFEQRGIRNLDSFRPDPELLQAVESMSRLTGFNPAFTAALIAQESGFNPKSVSLARALGLTQVTPVAEEEVSGVFSQWPRYPGINNLPAPILKVLVMTGEVNERNEWRLNPERSIRGGLAFAQMLADRWQDSDGFSKISWTGASASDPSDAEVARTRLILASYNSGYTRVTQAIAKHGPNWLSAPELKEARKYVNRIFSYCDSFQREGMEGVGEFALPPALRAPATAPAKPIPPALIKRVMHENET